MLSFQPAYLWVDLEMSGLDPLKNTILQFACILSDQQLTRFEEGPHIVIHCQEQHLLQMDQWNMTHHKASGLYEACLSSKTSLKQAEAQILSYLKSQKIPPKTLIIAGNSIHMDKLFLFHHMPQLNQFLHYRILDVSSWKTVVNAFRPDLFYKKKNSHRAVDDIRESIGELQFYVQNCMMYK